MQSSPVTSEEGVPRLREEIYSPSGTRFQESGSGDCLSKTQHSAKA